VDANIKHVKNNFILQNKMSKFTFQLFAKFHIVHCENTHFCLYVHIFTFSNFGNRWNLYMYTLCYLTNLHCFNKESVFDSITVNVMLAGYIILNIVIAKL
jgi:hypothetical protein